MSYPYQYDPNQCDSRLNMVSNNTTGKIKNEPNSQYDTFQSQVYGQMPAPIPYPSQPKNLLFPPMDFSVPPPNFQSQNVNAQFNQFVQTLPPLMPPVQSSYHNNPIENLSQSHQCSRSKNLNRNINDIGQGSKITSSTHRNNVSSSMNRSQRFRTRSRSRERDRNDRNRDRNRDKDRHRRSPRRDRISSRSDVRHSNYKRNDEPSRERDRHSSRSSSLHSNRSRNMRDDMNSRSSRSSRAPESRSSRPKTTSPIRKDDKEAKSDTGEKTERAIILEKWRSNFCETSEDIARKLEEMSEDAEKECWIRSSPADLFYKRTLMNEMEGTSRSETLCTLFETELIKRGQNARLTKPAIDQQPKKRKHRVCRHKSKSTNALISRFSILNSLTFIDKFR